MGTVKDRSDNDLIEAEEIKRDRKNTLKNCTKKILMTLDNHNGVVSHSEPVILDCEINKWALGSTKHFIFSQ